MKSKEFISKQNKVSAAPHHAPVAALASGSLPCAGAVVGKVKSPMTTQFNIKFYETEGCDLACSIKSPQGRTASAFWIGFDGRLSKHRTEANIEFASMSLELSENLVDQMIAAGEKFVEQQKQVEQEFALTNI